MSRKFIRDISRMNCSIFDIKAWYEGESYELKKYLGFGFYNTIFLVDKGYVTLFYDKQEVDEFYNFLNEKLDEELFNRWCDDFFEIIKESKNINDDEKIFSLMIRCWPALTIFHEISNYPEYANNFMIRRLERVRRNTETFSQNLSEKLKWKDESSENYVFFRGEIINKPFIEFINENDFEIIK